MQNAKLLAKELSQYRGKLLPLPIFLEIYKLIVPATIEIVPFYQDKKTLKILLVKRPKNDPTWPNLYHLPGTVVRQSDKINSFNNPFKRILGGELKNTKTIGNPVLIKPLFRNLGRGKEITLLHWVLIKNKPTIGKLFEINHLPENMIKQQIKYIEMAVKYFKK